MTTINNIVKSCRTEGTDYYTHVSMGKVRCKLTFSRKDREQFYKLYSKDIVKQKFIHGIAEKPQRYSQVVFDIDLKVKSEIPIPLYTEEQVKQVISICQEVIGEVVKSATDKNLICVFLNKDPYQSNGFTKNGFHLQFVNCFADRTEQSTHIIPRVQHLIKERNVFPDYIEPIDKNSCNVNWLLYGSVKEEGKKPYLLSKVFNYDVEEMSLLEAFGSYKIYDENENPIKLSSLEEITFNLPRIMSILPYGRPSVEVNEGLIPLGVNQFVEKEKTEYTGTVLTDDENLKVAKSLLPMIAYFRAEDRLEWLKVGWCLFTVSNGSQEGLILWNEFSSRCSDKYNEENNSLEWGKMRVGNMTIGTLRYYASIDNPEAYKVFQIASRKDKQNSSFGFVDMDTDEGLATYFFQNNDIFYHSKRKQLFVFNKKTLLWEQIEKDCLRTMMYDTFSILTIRLEEPDARNKFIMTIKKTSTQINILSSLWAMILMNSADTFIDANFDKKLGFFPIADGKVINLRTLEVRDRTKEDYFTRTTKMEFKPNPDEAFVRQYFGEVLSTKRREYVDWMLCVIGYCLTGENNMKQFYTLLGEKDTGKSLFLKMLGDMFQSYGGVVNDKVFRQSKTDSVHNTEAFSLIEKRVAFVSEMEEGDKFNEQLMKKISGGDDINIRGCGTNTNVVVNFNSILWLATNGIPKFSDKAFAERMRIISFNHKFENNPVIRDCILSHINDFFSVMCIHSQIYYNNGMTFKDVREVLESTKSVVDEQDSFKNWLDEENYSINDAYRNKTPELDTNEWRTKKTVVFASYTQYCVFHKVNGLGRTTFYKRMTDEFKLPTFDEGKVWRGIKEKVFGE